MAIAYSNASASAEASGTNSITTAAFSGSGSDLYLIASAAGGGNPAPSVTGMKWGGSSGTAMTSLKAETSVSLIKNAIYGLIAPGTGSNTVYASFSGTFDEAACGGIIYSGVDQTTPTGTAASANGLDSSPATVNVSSATGEMVVDGVFSWDGGVTGITVGANQTSRVEDDQVAGITGLGFGMSEEAGAGTVTMSWTRNATSYWIICAVPVKPVSGVSVNLTGQALTGAAGSIIALMGATGQAARAVTPDISNAGNWKRSSDAATTNLYAMVDETPPDDTDFIYVNTPSAVCEMTLGTVTDPSLSTGHRLRYRARSNNSASVKFSLYQGASLIAEWTESLTPVFANFERTLSNAEADTITNYADLRLRLTSI